MNEPRESIPARVFKYLGPDRISFLRDRRLRASPPSALNDPFELKPLFRSAIDRSLVQPDLDAVLAASWDELVDQTHHQWPEEVKHGISRETVKEILRATSPERSEVERIMNDAIDGLLQIANAELPKYRQIIASQFEGIGVICFSETAENLLMWSHYADAHQGFVVGFDASHAFFDRRRSSSDEFYHLRRVVYHASRPAIASFTEVTGSALFDTKPADYAYEREWRMLLPLSAIPTEPGTSSEIRLVEFPAGCISSIILGASATKEVVSAAREFRSQNPSVDLLDARIDDATYGITLSRRTTNQSDQD